MASCSRQRIRTAIMMLVIAAFPAHAVASLTLKIDPVQAAPGAAFDVPIEVAGAAGMEGVQFVLVFDPAVIENAEVTLAPLAGAGVVDRKVREPGKIRVAMFPENTLSEDGPLVIARFTATGAVDETSRIRIAEARAWTVTDRHPVEMLVAVEHGLVTIVPAEEENGPPIWLFALFLAAVIVVLPAARRKKASQETRESPRP